MSLHIQSALEALRSGEEAVRRATVDQLGRSRLAAAIPPLLGAVGDDSWPVRQAAAEHLTGFEHSALLPALEAALRNDEDAALRNAAMEIYVKLGAAAVEPLLSLLRDSDEEVRNFAAVMLGTLRDERAVPDLIHALQAPDVNVRHAAAASLGQVCSREAVAPLIEALRTEPWPQYPAIGALAEIGDPRAAPLRTMPVQSKSSSGPSGLRAWGTSESPPESFGLPPICTQSTCAVCGIGALWGAKLFDFRTLTGIGPASAPAPS